MACSIALGKSWKLHAPDDALGVVKILQPLTTEDAEFHRGKTYRGIYKKIRRLHLHGHATCLCGLREHVVLSQNIDIGRSAATFNSEDLITSEEKQIPHR